MLILFLFSVIVSCVSALKSMNERIDMHMEQHVCDESTAVHLLDQLDEWSYKMIKEVGQSAVSNSIYAPLGIGMLMFEFAIIDEIWRMQLSPALGFSTLDKEGMISERNRQMERYDNKFCTSTFTSVNQLFIGDETVFRILEKERCRKGLCKFGRTTDEYEMMNWFLTHTSNQLHNVPLPVNQSKIVAANYATFTCQWLYEFDVKETRVRTFSAVNKSAQIPFMHAHRYYMIGKLPGYDARVIALPFKWNNVYGAHMWIILPDELSVLDELTKDLYTVMTRATMSTRMELQELHLYLPIFEMQSSIDVTTHMKRMGVDESFFKGPTCDDDDPDTPPGVQRFMQITAISINETGTVSFDHAATKERYETDYKVESEVLKPAFNVNNPFVWMITGSAGVPLLSGIYRHPYGCATPSEMSRVGIGYNASADFEKAAEGVRGMRVSSLIGGK